MAHTDPDPTDLATRLREARTKAGLTQAGLAEALGVSRSAVAQWETGRAGQIRANLLALAAALGVSATWLLEGGGPDGTAAAEDSTELALLRLYRSLRPDDRQLLLHTALRLSRQPR